MLAVFEELRLAAILRSEHQLLPFTQTLPLLLPTWQVHILPWAEMAFFFLVERPFGGINLATQMGLREMWIHSRYNGHVIWPHSFSQQACQDQLQTSILLMALPGVLLTGSLNTSTASQLLTLHYSQQ